MPEILKVTLFKVTTPPLFECSNKYSYISDINLLLHNVQMFYNITLKFKYSAYLKKSMGHKYKFTSRTMFKCFVTCLLYTSRCV